ncbi:CDP-alcohol phosphatidyltransferase family protein [Candidatus Woesearchaeota archaeon]|jgi:phosphatidylglycerophosphate synthase|nr:CDP-alcohol phosphatidyltransferase family protein [Candidatus Woesearchaeota archaeon]MBT5397085.1 CDP-alcohol phosphatidyltransferase family protein [Candidatus Woesearchaeota archaeon]MBT6367369.1 CDP-alcohol phosphatidyltransferase family protein [Candidatus Woesearchaeota archaeon]MBT7762485.1 CDP-alcohol phosphatidyltransferase family protein [Candidatus Woesearchaeota archaeon]
MKPGSGEDKIYNTWTKGKDTLLSPIISILLFLRIKPYMITYGSIVSMILFFITLRTNITIAAVFLLITILSDIFDGALARKNKSCSDKGKFQDIVADNVNFSIFTFGIVYAGFLTGFWGMIIVYFMLLSKVLRIIFHSREYSSDWWFKAIAGALPNVVVLLSVIAFFILLLGGYNVFNLITPLLAGVLAIDSVFYFIRIVSQK